MDVRFLESFVTVAACGSIAEAARRLHLTPAAVAQRLRALERELGQPLVSRFGRTVRPTASGLAVLAHADHLIAAAHDLKAIAANNLPVGQLRLGATATALTGLLPGILATLGERYPRIDAHIRPGASVDLYHSVLAGEIDAALLVQPQFQLPKFTGWLTLRHEPLVLIAPADMPVADPHGMLRRMHFIRYDRNQWGGQIVDRYLRQHGLDVREWLELDALDAIAAFVHRGLGVSIVPDWAPPWPDGLRLHKIFLAGADVRQTGLLWNRSSPRIAAVQALIESCGSETRLSP